MHERLLQQLLFIKEIDKIKSIIRKSQHFSDENYENDAEHSWHISMMALILSEYSNVKIDILKVIKMLLIHDIVEIDAGDVYVYDKTSFDCENEHKAAERIFGMLPDDQSKEFLNLWLEFEERSTPEARFSNAIDRLQPVMQNIDHDCKTWKSGLTNHEKVINMNEKIGDGSKALWDYIKKEIDDAFRTIDIQQENK
ncbi:MAG: phosphohydrolase [Spirochaetes bacterium GWF1_31_7]|nr:MAG: phosphohydrolase [Spirochaetes bacterium GWE1_32_154]OHD50168.1 MAG: phosphohydrolase [Spirochaetes bacterium GWE2_31_10]OHD52482.1 MAG: phosphohydrolase [Spirochaetes bacterium GWF1_31_7]HBD94127.1 phosphohydrolase [Spirochaetia bacterium]HBI38640.1 phosphohydrolase [Spirochaetia bacterium]